MRLRILAFLALHHRHPIPVQRFKIQMLKKEQPLARSNERLVAVLLIWGWTAVDGGLTAIFVVDFVDEAPFCLCV